MVVLNLKQLKAVMKLMESAHIEQTIGNMIDLFDSKALTIDDTVVSLQIENHFYSVDTESLQVAIEAETDDGEKCYIEDCPFSEYGYCNLLHEFKNKIADGDCYAEYRAYAEQNDPYSGVAYGGSF